MRDRISNNPLSAAFSILTSFSYVESLRRHVFLSGHVKQLSGRAYDSPHVCTCRPTLRSLSRWCIDQFTVLICDSVVFKTNRMLVALFQALYTKIVIEARLRTKIDLW